MSLLDISGALPMPLDTNASSSDSVIPFTSYERKSAIVMAVAGLISCSFVFILLVNIIVSALLLWRQQKLDSPAHFIRKQIAVFVICLLVSDLIQSLSGVLQMKWVMENRIFESGACTMQAALLVMGDLGSTIWSCVIAVHTFSALALGRQWTRRTVYITVTSGWSFALILTVIGPTALEIPRKGRFFGNAGGWCFITSKYAIHRLVIHYIPLFAATVLIIVCYVLVFLVLRGSVSLIDGVRLSPVGSDNVMMRDRIVVAKRVLWYPVTYLACIFPIATIRLVGLKEDKIPDGIWTFGMTFLFLLGAINSVIYATTRHLIKRPRMSVHGRPVSSDIASLYTEGCFHTSPRQSGFSDVFRPDMSQALEMSKYDPTDQQRPQQGDDPRCEHEV